MKKNILYVIKLGLASIILGIFPYFGNANYSINLDLKDNSGKKYGFWGNVGLNICLPFNMSFTGYVKSSACKLNTEISNGVIKLKGDGKYTINVKYLGGYFGEPGDDGFVTKVTSKIKVKNNYWRVNYYPIGNTNNPLENDVNLGGYEKTIKGVSNGNFSIISYVWDLDPRYGNPKIIKCSEMDKVDPNLYKVYKSGIKCYKKKKLYKTSYANDLKNWYLYKTVEGDRDSENVIVLKNGDSIQKILKNYDQSVTLQPGIKKYIAPYVKNGKIVLKDNQFLYLFEFNNITLCKLNKTCDYQDSVILVTINKEDNLGNVVSLDCSNQLNSLVKVSFNPSCNDKCYIPLFGINGGFSMGENNMVGNMRFGIYYDCNSTTKEEVIRDYCNEIETRLIKKTIESKCSGGIFNPNFWLCNIFSMMNQMWNNMNEVWAKIDSNDWLTHFRIKNPFDNIFKQKKYIAVFKEYKDNEEFYNTYCVDDEYKKEYEICYNNKTIKVKMYDLYEYLNKGAKIGACDISSEPPSVNEDLCNISSQINNGLLVIKGNRKYQVKVKYLGGKFAYENKFALRVTSRVKIGNHYIEAKGSYDNPLLGDVNYTPGTEVTYISDNAPSLSIESKTWDLKDYRARWSNWRKIDCAEIDKYTNKEGFKIGKDRLGNCYYSVQLRKDNNYINNLSNWKVDRIVVGSKDNKNTIVLKNGDSINKILAYYDETKTGQPGVKEFIKNYVEGGKIKLRKNQFLYLFEFNDLKQCKLNKTCDYQDSIVLIEINPIENNKVIDCSKADMSPPAESDPQPTPPEDNPNPTPGNNNDSPYIRIDEKNSSIIFEYGKSYRIFR